MIEETGKQAEVKILIAEDEIIVAEDLALTLRDLGYEVAGTAATGELAVQLAQESTPTLILMDIELAGDMDGIEASEQIRSRLDVPVIFLTAYDDKDVLFRAKQTEPYGYLTKPFSNHLLKISIDTALYKHAADRRVRESEELYRKLVETTDTGYVIIDDDGRVLDANSEYVRLTGRNGIDEIKGRSVLEWTAEHDKLRNADEVARCLREGSVRNLEIDYVDNEGVLIPIEINATVTKGVDGTRIVSLCRGIIDRKKSQASLVAQRDLSMALSAASSVEEAFNLCLKSAMETSGMEAAGIYVAKDDECIELATHIGLPEQFLEKVKHFPKDLPESKITMRGEPVYFSGSLPELSPFVVQALRDEGFRASAVIPILHHGRVVCSLHLSSRKLDEVGQETRNSIEAIASMIGAALSRIRAEEAFRESEYRYSMLVDTMNGGLAVSDETGRLTYVNDRLVKMLGYTREEFIGASVLDFHDEEGREQAELKIAQKISAEVPRGSYETRLRAKDGHMVPVILSSSGIYGPNNEFKGIVAICTDITERKQIEERLSKSLEEKEALLREIHHRVKNNLAVVSSLLGLQSRHAKDQHHRSMFIESQDRIRSMALAHEKMYQAQNLSAINSRDYLSSLVQHLMAALSHVGTDVRLRSRIAEVNLDLETGVTLGFIVTELVSNCLKHAFPEARAGKISLVLKEIDDSMLELSVADDGVGLPDNFQFQKPSTLGLDLVRIFSRQLRGSLEVRRKAGTEIIVRFNRAS